jgi:Fur family zinc uptake transcriptional regulator
MKHQKANGVLTFNIGGLDMSVDLKTPSFATETPNINAILAQAEQIIDVKGGRFTAIRKHIYQLLLAAPHPLGAYEIIENLDGVGAQKPPTVYRALAWLIEHGLVAKIEYNSRYAALPLGIEADDLAFVICRECGDTDTFEAPGLSKSLHQTARDRGFADTQMVMEIIGLCGGHKRETN